VLPLVFPVLTDLRNQMFSRLSRRSFLQATASTFAAPLLGPMQAPARDTQGPALTAFPLAHIRLLDGEFKAAAAVNQRYLESLSVNRLLYSFCTTAGLKTSAAPYGGWEDPACELRGHFAGGHYLSAAALAYAGSGNDVLRARADAMVSQLAACQKAHGNGYVSAFSPALFDKLAKGQEVWAPFYTLHKIMAGLIEMHRHTGNEQALQVAEGMGGWTLSYLAGTSTEQRQKMLQVEFGGMVESLADLYQITGKERYLAAARLFEQPDILDPLAAHRDALQGLHANTTAAKIVGIARMYEVTGEPRYREIAEYFLYEVLGARSYVIGNTSEKEYWNTPPSKLQHSLTLRNAECCVAYNLMKLDRHVFAWTGDVGCMDHYERALFNCRLGTQNTQGLKQYFFPLGSGYWRIFGSPAHSFWCCTGTGAEEFTKFTDTIYFHSGEAVYVNQFIASELTWTEKNFGLQQHTRFPAEPGSPLQVRTPRPQERSLHLRIPRWVAAAPVIKVNGRVIDTAGRPGSYLELRRVWSDGDSVEIELPMQLAEENLPGDEATVAALYGPLVLAADLGPGPVAGSAKILEGRSTFPTDIDEPGPLPVLSTPDRTHASAPRDGSKSSLRPHCASKVIHRTALTRCGLCTRCRTSGIRCTGSGRRQLHDAEARPRGALLRSLRIIP
jgi:DUF1680 family protein